MEFNEDQDARIPLIGIQHGSHLYGMNRKESDQDVKVLYWPKMSEMMMGLEMKNFKFRWDQEGNKITEHEVMSVDGLEEEWIALPTFFKDCIDGQAYALELYSVMQQGLIQYERPPKGNPNKNVEVRCAWTMQDAQKIMNSMRDCLNPTTLKDMIQYAKNQTIDYERKVSRMDQALEQVKLIESLLLEISSDKKNNIKWGDQDLNGKRWIDRLRELDEKNSRFEIKKVEIGSGKQDYAIVWNRKSYNASSYMTHTLSAIKKASMMYGHRVQVAHKDGTQGKEAWDGKSMAHAIRVFEQAIEWVQKGCITFPRPNSNWLKQVRNKEIELEEIKMYWGRLSEKWKELEIMQKYEEKSIEDRIQSRLFQIQKAGLKMIEIRKVMQSDSIPVRNAAQSLRKI